LTSCRGVPVILHKQLTTKTQDNESKVCFSKLKECDRQALLIEQNDNQTKNNYYEFI
tara:strand:- start:290 stop:460 length:171 start_codon:yes stop_codon:yes gene_type:complete